MAAYRKRKRRSVHFRSDSPEWATPHDLFNRLDALHGPFTLDPCATPANAKCASYFTVAEDGLAQPWTGRVFVNPPYGRGIGQWVQRAYEASQTTAEIVVCLLPARTDTRWWHDYCARGEVEFLPGRVRFGDGANAAPFPSAVVVFRNSAAVTKLADETGLAQCG